METEEIQKKDLATFLAVDADTGGASKLPRSIVNDLVVSKTKLAMVYIGGSVAGYLLSLAICAQCSIGLSPLAWKTADIFQSMSAPWCALFCGSIFGIAPFLASLVLLTRFQHRYLLFRMTWMPVLIPIIASILMTAVGTNHDWSWQSSWMLAAIFTPYILEVAAGSLLKQSRWKPQRG